MFTEVTLRVIVTPFGKVESAKAIDGPSQFYGDAEQIEMEREFKPFEKDGTTVRASIEDYVRILPPVQWAANKLSFPEIKDLLSLRIQLERTSCFGMCPAYSVEIRGDGSITFSGGLSALISGVHHGKTSDGAVTALVNQFRRADYFSLRDQYKTNVTDNPTYTTSIEYDGHKKQVVDYAGLESGMPEIVVALENGIDETAGTEKWLREHDQTWPSLLSENWDFTAQNEENQALFANVIARGSSDLIQKFVAAGAIPLDLARNGLDALASAASKGNAALVAQIMSGHNHLPAALLLRPLFEAAQSGSVETVDLLVAKGADVNGLSAEIDGVPTVLMAAARSGKAVMVAEILKYHPDLGKKDSDGDTVLASFLRASNVHPDTAAIIQVLVGAGVDVNSRNDEGETPLFSACFNASSVRPLAAAGADLNAKNRDGLTALMNCTMPDFIKAMIAAGADLSVQNKKGETAAQWFRSAGLKEQAEILEAAMKAKTKQ
jgi:ankyrin repeat protein